MAQSHKHQSGAFVIHDIGEISYVNSEFLSLFNFDSREALLGTSLRNYVSKPDYDSLAEQFDRIGAGSASALGLTVTITDSTGHARDVIALSSPVQWDGETHIQTLCVDVDSELTSSNLIMNTMEISPIGISIADARKDDRPLIYVNDEFVKITGYSQEEVLGQNCRFLQGDDTKNEKVAQLRTAIENKEPITVELRNYHKEGSMFWNRLSLRPIRNDNDEVTHYLGFQEDISDLKVYAHERTLFETQASTVDKTIFVTDSNGIIQYVNPQFELTTGYTAEEAIGQTPQILKSGEQDEDFYTELWETIGAGDVWEATITNERKSGKQYTVEQKIVPITDEDGAVTHFVSVEEDITEQVFTEEVLGVMSRILRHNVRNSVGVIKGNAEMLEQKNKDPDDRAALQAIQRRATDLEAISNKSRNVRELLRRRHKQHSLRVAAIANFVEQRRSRHPEAQIDFSMDVSTDCEIENGSLLQMGIDEALENAIVHTDQEQPHVEVTVTEDPDVEIIQIEIADNSPKIPADEWNVISSGRETPLEHGSRIGLWLMYWTMTALGGTIGLTENEPRGNIITYRVPLGANETTEDYTLTKSESDKL